MVYFTHGQIDIMDRPQDRFLQDLYRFNAWTPTGRDMASTLQVASLQVEISDNFTLTLVYRQNWEQARKRES